MTVHRLSAPLIPTAVEPIAERMERLRHEASALASEHVEAFLHALSETATLAAQVAEGGEAYPVGVRQIARRAGDDLTAAALSLQAIRGRLQ